MGQACSLFPFPFPFLAVSIDGSMIKKKNRLSSIMEKHLLPSPSSPHRLSIDIIINPSYSFPATLPLCFLLHPFLPSFAAAHSCRVAFVITLGYPVPPFAGSIGFLLKGPDRAFFSLPFFRRRDETRECGREPVLAGFVNL